MTVESRTVQGEGMECVPAIAAGRSVDLMGIVDRSINYLTRIAPPEEHYIPYFGGKLPLDGFAHLVHCPWDYGDGIGRILEALSFVRRMTGSSAGMDIQHRLIRNLCSFYGPDGVTYRQSNAWSDHVAGTYELRSSTLALVALLEDGCTEIEPVLSRAIDGLSLIFSPEELHRAVGCWNGEKWVDEGAGVGMPSIDALIRCYTVTGWDKALRLAERMVEHYFLGPQRHFSDDGALVFPDGEKTVLKPDRPVLDYEASVGHFHTRTSAAIGLARYGVITHDAACLDQARRIYDRLMQYGTEFGWFPENLFTDGHEVSELCCTLDMMEVQLLLASAGHIELYDVAERFVRNHIAVSQFVPDGAVRDWVVENPALIDPTGRMSYTDVLSRLSGGFVCVTYPNDLYTAYPCSRRDSNASYLIDISGCCSGSGAKAAYVAWKSAITEDDSSVTVNMALDRSHPAVDVVCRIGAVTTIGLTPKCNKAIRLRIPEWANADRTVVTCGGKPVKVTREPGYLRIDPTPYPNEQIVFQVETPTIYQEVQVAGEWYGIEWRAGMVMRTNSPSGSRARRNPYTEPFDTEYAGDDD